MTNACSSKITRIATPTRRPDQERPSLYGIHYEARAAPEATGSNSTPAWDGWHHPIHGEMLASGAWQGRLLRTMTAPHSSQRSPLGRAALFVGPERHLAPLAWPGVHARLAGRSVEQYARDAPSSRAVLPTS
jgi:hypothetical protein